MIKIFKSVITGCLLTVALSVTSAGAKPITMNLGFGGPMKSMYGDLAVAFEKYAEKYTNGTVDVKLRPSNQISTEDKAFKAMQLGTVDSFIITTNNVSPHWPLMDILGLPYVFQNVDHMESVVTGDIGTMMKQRIYKDTKVHMLAFGPAGYRDFFNSKRPINSMADMKGLKIRVPKNEVMIKTFEAFGANPVPLAWSETPTALQTGTVDGGDNGAYFIRDLKFFEHQKYLSILDYFIVMAPLLVSDHFIKRLNAEQQEQINRAAVDASSEVRQILNEQLSAVRTWLVNEGGMTMTTPDRTEFIKAAQGVQKHYMETRGAEFANLVNKIQDSAK